MKILNVKLLAAFLFLGLMVFTACDETTTNPTDDAPVITSVTPNYGISGDTVTINGTDFGLDTDPGTVFFTQGTTEYKVAGKVGNSDYVSWSPTQIKVKIPAGIPLGAAKIKVYNGATELTSNSVDFTIGKPPAGPSDAMATSKSSTSIIVKWTPSTDANVVKHMVYIYQGSNLLNAYPTADKTTDRMTITGLTEGTVYTFTIKAVNSANLTSTDNVSVNWSPASRFYDDQVIKMYETDSDNPSGIELFDPTSNGPAVRSVTDRSKVNIAINTKGGGLLLQCGSAIDVGSGTAPVTEMYEDFYYLQSSLDEIFESVALNSFKYSAASVNLLSNNINQYAGFIVRTKEPGQTDYNYAKLFFKKVGGSFLQGTAPNRYVECVISYQKVTGVPYAR